MPRHPGRQQRTVELLPWSHDRFPKGLIGFSTFLMFLMLFWAKAADVGLLLFLTACLASWFLNVLGSTAQAQEATWVVTKATAQPLDQKAEAWQQHYITNITISAIFLDSIINYDNQRHPPQHHRHYVHSSAWGRGNGLCDKRPRSYEDYATVAKQTSTMTRMTCDCLLGRGAWLGGAYRG